MMMPIKNDLEVQEQLERSIKVATKQVLGTKEVKDSLFDHLVQSLVKDYVIDSNELIEYTEKTLKEKPNIADESLAILLLHKVANNPKYKQMAEIAKEMINEKWWDKNG